MKEKVYIFNNTIMNIPNNFISHETIVCDDKDPIKAIKSLIQEKKDTFKKYHKSNNNIQLLQRLKFLQEKLNSFISVSVTSSVSVTLRIWTLRRSIYRNNYILYTREINFFVRIYIFCPPFFCTVRRKFRQMQLR